MKVYFNWLGSWVELTDDDSIMDMNPSDFVYSNIPKNFYKDDLDEGCIIPQFVTIRKNNTEYHIHISQIVWKDNIEPYYNEEKWQ